MSLVLTIVAEGASSILNRGESLEVSTTTSAVAVANQTIRHLYDLSEAVDGLDLAFVTSLPRALSLRDR